MAAPRIIDYGRIEPGWRAGKLSVQQLADEYEKDTGKRVARSAIQKHFNGLGIPRDLSAKIKAKFVLEPEIDEFDASGFVYVIYLDAPDRFYKVGMAKHFSSRFEAHQCASPFDLCVACAYFVPNMRVEERSLHVEYADKRVRGEWFMLGDDDLRNIASRSLLV